MPPNPPGVRLVHPDDVHWRAEITQALKNDNTHTLRFLPGHFPLKEAVNVEYRAGGRTTHLSIVGEVRGKSVLAGTGLSRVLSVGAGASVSITDMNISSGYSRDEGAAARHLNLPFHLSSSEPPSCGRPVARQ